MGQFDVKLYQDCWPPLDTSFAKTANPILQYEEYFSVPASHQQNLIKVRQYGELTNYIWISPLKAPVHLCAAFQQAFEALYLGLLIFR